MGVVGTEGSPDYQPAAAPGDGTTSGDSADYELKFPDFANNPAFAEVMAGDRMVLGHGDGEHVEAVEAVLNFLGHPVRSLWGFGSPEAADSDWEHGTTRAVRDFQRANGLEPTGDIDRTTLIAMDRGLVSAVSSEAVPDADALESGNIRRAGEIVPPAILSKHGLDPDTVSTHSKYDGHDWELGYFPYTGGDGQYDAFARHAQVFGEAAAGDAHPYFEFYGNPPSGLQRGSWIANGQIREADFEATAGVSISGERPIDNAAYKALRESGAPKNATFALLDQDGKQIPVGAGDRLVPVAVNGGVATELTGGTEGRADLWALKRADGSIDYRVDYQHSSAATLAGADDGVKFDFLDAQGQLVSYLPARDRIVETWTEPQAQGTAGDPKTHVLAKNQDGGYTHQVIENAAVVSEETLGAEEAAAKRAGQDVIHRVQKLGTNELKGDGKVGESFNMGWWGKCHNVASINTTNMPKPSQPVAVVTNAGPGDEIGLIHQSAGGPKELLKPVRGAGNAIDRYDRYALTADGSAIAGPSLGQVSVQDARAMGTGGAMVVSAGGALKQAETTYFTPEHTTAITAHIGDGAVVPKGGGGERYYAAPDAIALKDGREIRAHIKSVETASGKTEEIGRRSGTDFVSNDRGPLRAPGMTSRTFSQGRQRMAFNLQSMEGLNDYRSDDVTKLTVIHPDGREEVIDASDVTMVAWENKYDFPPEVMWGLHKSVEPGTSTVIEKSSDTQVWNYAIRDVSTQPLTFDDLSPAERSRAALPGMKTGTIGNDNKYFFETEVESDGGTDTYRYWARFDDDGNVADFAYLTNDVPDFVWTQHVKDVYSETWTGESQAPGITNGQIQRMYLASTGGLDSHTLPGGYIRADDLRTATPVKPSAEQ